jgi:cell division protein FtsZ
MYKQGIVGVDFAICNTDNQALENSPIPVRIALGPSLTEGRGAGSKPETGKEACIESIDEVRTFLSDGTKMLFITAGMGGGTGTGAAPIIAKVSRDLGILTVGIVTLPFSFEGLRRNKNALEGLENLKKSVDAILVISNDKIREMYGDLELSRAFSNADEVLNTAAKAIAEIITVPGYINVDFEDVNFVMRESGIALMGSGMAEGADRGKKAIERALNSPLLENNDIRGAKNILLNICSGTKEVTMDEVNEITQYIQQEAGYGTDLIWGNCKEEALGDKISVTLIATGFDSAISKTKIEKPQQKEVVLESQFDGVSDINDFTITEIGNTSAKTIEFDDDFIKTTVEEHKGKNPYQIDPFLVSSPGRIQQKTYSEAEMERKERLRSQTVPLDSPEALEKAEKVPAYLRRGTLLENDVIAKVSNLKVSSTTYVDEEGTIIQTANTYTRVITD